ncbi:hypothetical protein DH2020_028689 [Rehmannia glutinosa]|uniref:Protein kinase domain-containing protein n=1 Tax=Rehmannia glutinosa TaxID=99300 RepID=A0ABR0VUA6_REHGL
MDLTNWDNIGKTLIHHLNCYKSTELNETILDSTENGNFRERYVLGDQLGWGRFGIIRECSDKLTGEVLACKSIAKERLVTEDDVRSVKLEIEILTKLSGHENVVDLKAVYEEEDYVHLLMELCAGGELFHQIEKQGRLSEHEAHVIFKQLMEVVMYCHDKGIVHRDLKPENILLVSRSSSSPIKLADFGLATHIKPGQTLHGTVGSPFYIAPEVLVGGYNQAADVWSAGVILYILLSGIPPFWGKTKSSIFDAVRAAKFCFHSDPWDHISTSAKDLISGMLCFVPSKRLTAAQVLGAPLNAFLKNSVLREPNAAKFSSPIPSMPSFTFSTPTAALEQSDESLCFKTKMLSIDGEPSIRKLILLPDPAQPTEQMSDEMEQRPEVRRGGRTSVSKTTSLQSKRNHTIGLGELDHLDLIATVSVSRWASCTQIPSALRSSLVC